jgi:hypothetical protein
VRSVDPMVWERPPGLPPSPDPEAVGLWPNLSDGGVPQGLDPVGSASERYDLLGYDVADYDLLGGLTNCGYTPEEAASLAPVWAPRLNEWHLFGDPDDATAYAEVTSQRVPEHAPFFGYGIYQLRRSAPLD